MENINGGFPPIKMENKVAKTSDKEKVFVKERGFTSNLSNVNIQNIIKSKKENIIKEKKDDLEIVESL